AWLCASGRMRMLPAQRAAIAPKGVPGARLARAPGAHCVHHGRHSIVVLCWLFTSSGPRRSYGIGKRIRLELETNGTGDLVVKSKRVAARRFGPRCFPGVLQMLALEGRIITPSMPWARSHRAA